MQSSGTGRTGEMFQIELTGWDWDWESKFYTFVWQPDVLPNVHAHTRACVCVCADAVSGAKGRLRSKSQQAQED